MLSAMVAPFAFIKKAFTFMPRVSDEKLSEEESLTLLHDVSLAVSMSTLVYLGRFSWLEHSALGTENELPIPVSRIAALKLSKPNTWINSAYHWIGNLFFDFVDAWEMLLTTQQFDGLSITWVSPRRNMIIVENARDKQILICIRGTLSARELALDATAVPVPDGCGNFVHAGFLIQSRELWASLEQYYETRFLRSEGDMNTWDIMITGHSLGAACSEIILQWAINDKRMKLFQHAQKPIRAILLSNPRAISRVNPSLRNFAEDPMVSILHVVTAADVIDRIHSVLPGVYNHIDMKTHIISDDGIYRSMTTRSLWSPPVPFLHFHFTTKYISSLLQNVDIGDIERWIDAVQHSKRHSCQILEDSKLQASS